MFTRDKAIKILETLFNYELQLFQANLPGHFFLQLKMPYNGFFLIFKIFI